MNATENLERPTELGLDVRMGRKDGTRMTVNRRRRSWAERVERDLARADRAANLAARKASTIDNPPADALSQDECDAIGADGRDGRGWITESNLSPAEADALAAYRQTGDSPL